MVILLPKRKNWILCVFLAFSMSATAQVTGPQQVWQLSGLVVSKSEKQPVSFATIQINHTRRGMMTSQDGFYSLPVTEKDTVWISSLGFKKTAFLVAEYLKEYEGEEESHYVYAIHYLPEDSILLPTVMMYAYDTPEKLKTAMLAMSMTEDPQISYARNNMEAKILNQYLQGLAVDDGERMLVGRQLYYQRQQNQMKVPVLNFFNPIAALQLLQYINEKSKKKKEKDLNYWKDN